MKFSGKVVLITGVATGIGAALTKAFVREGAAVFGLDIVDEGQLDPNLMDPNFIYRKKDVTSLPKVKSIFAEIEELYGRIDILINNVGGFTQIKYCEDIEEKDWDFLIDLNLKSCFLTCKFALPLMKRQHSGKIINMSSIAGRRPVGRSNIAYGSGKAAVVGFTKYLAFEVASWNITVNAVSPITTLTPRVKKARSQDDIIRISSTIPLGRLAEPQDTVAAVLFLASEEAGFITGITIDVTGGAYMG